MILSSKKCFTFDMTMVSAQISGLFPLFVASENWRDMHVLIWCCKIRGLWLKLSEFRRM